MNFNKTLARSTSFLLITLSIYQTLLSLNAIFFIYPHLNLGADRDSLITQGGLIEKALVLYTIMATDGMYGIALLFKSVQEVKTIHIAIGLMIALGSAFFMTQTPFTTDPLINLILRLTRLKA